MIFQIVTNNSKYVDMKYVSSYHEIHEITGLRNSQHVIATINSIVANNLLFKECGATLLPGYEEYPIEYDTKLDSVIISSDDQETLKKVMDHYKENPLSVKVEEVEAHMLKEMMIK